MVGTDYQDLVSKIAAIVKKVGWVEKTGHNDFHNYDYVTEADIVATLRDHLADAGVIMIPQLEKITIKTLDKGVLATVKVVYVFTDGKGQFFVTAAGMGYDTPGDKAAYKAMTGAEKYALKQLFLIPTGDDPERDIQDHGDSGRSTAGPGRGGASDKQSGRSGNATPAPTRHDKRADSGAVPTIKFGAGKGKTLKEATDQELIAWTKTMEEAVKKNDPKWHKSNVERLDECRNEWERRIPWREAWKSIVQIGKEHGLDEEGCQTILKGMGYEGADKLKPASVTEFKDKLESLTEEK
jgi:ERF superfamily